MGWRNMALEAVFVKSFVFKRNAACAPGFNFCLAWLIGLGPVETTAVVFWRLPIGVNVHLMCKQFHAAADIIANAMIITTVMCSFTIPLAVTVLRHFFPMA